MHKYTINWVKKLLEFNRGFIHFHIILTFVDMIIKFFIIIHFAIIYFPVVFVKYIYLRVYKLTYFMNYFTMAKALDYFWSTIGYEVYEFIYGYLKENKRIKHSMEIVKEKFEGYKRTSRHSRFAIGER